MDSTQTCRAFETLVPGAFQYSSISKVIQECNQGQLTCIRSIIHDQLYRNGTRTISARSIPDNLFTIIAEFDKLPFDLRYVTVQNALVFMANANLQIVDSFLERYLPTGSSCVIL